MKNHIKRLLESVVRQRFFEGKALVVYGARQVGKTTLAQRYDVPHTVQTLAGFRGLAGSDVAGFIKEYGLAMDGDDLAFCQAYFRAQGRDPTLTEIRVIDTYWSDHCRHTTFLTVLDGAHIHQPTVEKAFRRYLTLRETLYGDRHRPINLMDIATIGAKALKRDRKSVV